MSKGEVKETNRGIQYIEIDGVVTRKRCTKCLEMKDLENFYASKRNFAGVVACCRDCIKTADSQNLEKRKARMELFKMRNPEYFKTYRENNRTKIREKDRRYYHGNKGRVLTASKKWRRENLDKQRESARRRSKMKALLPDTITTQELEGVLRVFGNACAMTGEVVNIEMDHVIPVSVGRGGNVLGNIIPLTSSMNSSKHNNNIFEWFEFNKDFMNLSQNKFNYLIKYLAEINKMTVADYTKYVYWCHENPITLEELEGQ